MKKIKKIKAVEWLKLRRRLGTETLRHLHIKKTQCLYNEELPTLITYLFIFLIFLN